MTACKCPNCAAILRVNGDENFVKCDYCGTVISMDRKPEEMSDQRAQALAQKVREYRKKRNSINEAKADFEKKSNALSEIMKKSNGLSNKVILYSVLIWVAANSVFSGLMRDIFYDYDVIRIFLNIVFCIGSAFFAFKTAQNIKVKKMEELNEKKEQAQLQLNYAKKKYDELCDGFDENFIPDEARNDEAINYIIKALETEKAYSIKQATAQWEEYSEMEEKLREAKKFANEQDIEDIDNPTAKSETLSTIAGAALGAFGGAVAREAIKEIKRHL